MKNALIKKLKSRKGDSLAEVLVAVLISLLALGLLGTMVSTSSKMVSKSVDTMDVYYDSCSDLVEQNPSPSNPTGSVEIEVKTETDTYETVNLKKDETSASRRVMFFVNSGFADQQVISYTRY